MALAADRKTSIVAGGSTRYRNQKVGAAVKPYKGGLVCWNATGYLAPAAATLGFKVAGLAQETVDNSGGGAGDLELKYLTGVSAKLKNSGTSAIVQADIGKPCYVEDDETVAKAPGAAGVVAGIIEDIDADGGIWVFVAPEASSVDGIAGQDVSTVSATQTAAGVPVIYDFDIADAATADYDRIVDQKFEVIDVVVVKTTAGAGNTVQVKNAATAITDAIAAAVDKAVTRAGTIDRAQAVVAAGGTLRITVTRAAGSAAVQVRVIGIKRA
jgi:hypothetical protein